MRRPRSARSPARWRSCRTTSGTCCCCTCGPGWTTPNSPPRWRCRPALSGPGCTGPANTHPDLREPTYTYLTTLPTDPDALLATIRAAVGVPAGSKPGAVPDPDMEVFSIIGGLLSQAGMLPPQLGGALYRAAARIPGVTLVADAVDAAGRHGIGVRRARPPLAVRRGRR
jgi:hypothetical protein